MVDGKVRKMKDVGEEDLDGVKRVEEKGKGEVGQTMLTYRLPTLGNLTGKYTSLVDLSLFTDQMTNSILSGSTFALVLITSHVVQIPRAVSWPAFLTVLKTQSYGLETLIPSHQLLYIGHIVTCSIFTITSKSDLHLVTLHLKSSPDFLRPLFRLLYITACFDIILRASTSLLQVSIMSQLASLGISTRNPEFPLSRQTRASHHVS